MWDTHSDIRIRGNSTTKLISVSMYFQSLCLCPLPIIHTVHTCVTVLYQVQRDKNAWPFLEPVTREIAPDYFDVIDKPMDISVIRGKATRKDYSSKTQFIDDFNLIVDNCTKYNGSSSGQCPFIIFIFILYVAFSCGSH